MSWRYIEKIDVAVAKRGSPPPVLFGLELTWIGGSTRTVARHSPSGENVVLEESLASRPLPESNQCNQTLPVVGSYSHRIS